MPTNQPSLSFAEEFELDPQQKVEAREALADIERLNTELGLAIPEEASEQEVTLWEALNRQLRQLYDYDYIDKDQVEYIVTTFYEQSTADKERALQGLTNMFADHNDRMNSFTSIWEQENTKELVQDIVLLLPPELREEFLYYLEKGEEMPQSLKNKARSSVAEDEAARSKLDQVLSGDNRLLTTKTTEMKTLSPADLRAKFNVAPKNVITQDEEGEKNGTTN